jgi:hypothetical protein
VAIPSSGRRIQAGGVGRTTRRYIETLVVRLTSLAPQKMEAADVKEFLLRVTCVHFDLHFRSGDVLVAPRTVLTGARATEGLERGLAGEVAGRKFRSDSSK